MSRFKSVKLKKRSGKRMLNLKLKMGTKQKLKYFIQNNDLYLIEEEKDIKDNQRYVRIALSIEIKYKIEQVENDKYLYLRLMKKGASFDDKIENSIDKLGALFGMIKSKANHVKYWEVVIVLKEEREKITITNDLIFEHRQERKLKYCKELTADLINVNGGLIVGRSGSGKTYYLYYLLHNMLKETYNIYLVDGKFYDLKEVARKMGVRKIAEDLDSAIAAIEQVHKIMIDRNEQRKNKEDTLFLVIDEYLILLSRIANEISEKKKKEIEKKLIDITLLGRSVGICLIIALQRLGQENDGLNLRIRDNLATKIGIGELKDTNFKMLFDKTKDNTIINRKKGQGYIQSETLDDLVAFDVAKLDFCDEIKELITSLKN